MAETTTVAERTLPHNLEAERSVLGAILIQNDAYNLAVELVRPEDFYRDAHRRIFEKIIALAERRSAIDFVTLKEELSRGGRTRRRGRAGVHRVARGRRAAGDQRRVLREDRQGEVGPPEADRRGQHDPARRLRGRPGRRRDPRPRRALDLPDRRGPDPHRLHVDVRHRAAGRRGDPEGPRREEADHRRADRLQGAGRPHVRLPARRPHHPRGAALDGQDHRWR